MAGDTVVSKTTHSTTTTTLGAPPGTVAIVQSWQRHVTITGMCVGIAILCGWDVYAAWDKPHSDTISEVTLSFFWMHPAVAAGVGYLMGHLTWPDNSNSTSKVFRTAMLIGVMGALATVDFAFHLLPHMPPIVPFAIGLPLGHLLWPQILEA